MTSSAGLRFKTYLLILIMVIFGPVGDVLLRDGMRRTGKLTTWAPAGIFHFFVRTFTSGTIWLGIGSLVVFFVAYMLVLSWADFSYVQPASTLSYGVVALMGYFLLGETVSPVQWTGVGIICLGVFVVGNTHPRTTEPE
jgi:drug/metabolite transporter (DMT)-like permease